MKTRKDRTFCNENPSGYRRLLPARETIRAQWHDYRESDYFVTVCTQNRVHYFGEVYNGQMELTAVGEYLTAEIENVSDHYPYVEIPVYVIMPDHIHLIVAIHPRSSRTRFIASANPTIASKQEELQGTRIQC